MKLRTLVGFLLALLSQPFLFSQRTISGIVTNIDNIPLIGVTILVKDFTIGTTTDLDGKYSLEVPEGARFLIFSYLGFSDREVEIGLKESIDVRMREAISFLDEVVVTGLAVGTSTRKTGFNIAKISEDEFREVPGVNVAIALQAKVPGVQIKARGGLPGSNPSIRIRGSNNLFGFPSSPLVIVDGIQLQEPSNLADINSEDIESIEVIKGAAATSLYGSRAGSGVVNIMTKRGSSTIGETEIIFRNEFGKSDLPREIERNEHHHYAFKADGSIDYSNVDPDQIADNEYPKLYDHHSLFFDPGISMTNTLSIRSRTEDSNYFISLNNTQQSGTVILLDGYKRQSLRANIDHKITPALKLRFSNYYAQSTSDEPDPTGYYSPFYNLVYQSAGANLEEPNEEDGSPYNWDTPGGPSPFVYPNPLYDLYHTDKQFKVERYSGSLGLNLKILPFLNLDGSYSIDRRSTTYDIFADKGYLAFPPWAEGYALRTHGKRTYQTANSKLTFSKHYRDFILTSQAAIIYEDDVSESFDVEAYDFRFKGVRSLNNSSNSNPDGTGSTSINRTSRSSNDFTIKSLNYYLTGTIDWKDKIIVDGLIRFDGSSLFGSDNRWNTFYRTSLAYRLTEDVTIPNVEELKFRLSYGTSGNRPNFEYRFETLNSDGSKNTLGNRNLKPSIKTELEIGFDARILDRLNFEFSYARAINSALFYNVDLPNANGGFASQWQNIDAELKATSFEFALEWEAIRKKNFSLSVDLTFDRLRQIFTKWDFPDLIQGLYRFKKGNSYTGIFLRKFARSIEELSPHQLEGKLFVVNNEGWLVESDKIGTVDEKPILVEDENGNNRFILGDFNPDFDMGFGLNTSWGNFQMYCLFHWRSGVENYNFTKQGPTQELKSGIVDQSDKPYHQRKPVGYYLAFSRPFNNFFLEDGSYLKMREVALSYNLDTSAWKTVGNAVKSIRFSIIGRNLFTITRYSGYDPEVAWFNTQSDANVGGIDTFNYPNFRTITGMLEIRF